MLVDAQTIPLGSPNRADITAELQQVDSTVSTGFHCASMIRIVHLHEIVNTDAIPVKK